VLYAAYRAGAWA